MQELQQFRALCADIYKPKWKRGRWIARMGRYGMNYWKETPYLDLGKGLIAWQRNDKVNIGEL